jgi:hypothetical protein
MSTPFMQIRPGNPDFLDLPWDLPLLEWSLSRLIELPTGMHRHPVRFVAYDEGLYAVKELPLRLAHHEFEVLRSLSSAIKPVVAPVGIVERQWLNPGIEGAGAVITRYVEFAFPYRELISEGGFGVRRDQMLDAFAGLLVELHLAGCFWGDCSLSNVLYRYDAETIQAIMIDAETVRLYPQLSPGQRRDDLDIMIMNVAGGMADIAASQGLDIDDADLYLGEDIAARYEALWSELERDIVVGPEERYKIGQHISRLNELGFEVEDVVLTPDESGGQKVRIHVAVCARAFHATRLRELTRIDASEHQARQILADLRYFEANNEMTTATGKSVAAIKWRVEVFEPLLRRIRELLDGDADPVQGYCDFLHHRYLLAAAQGRDIANDEAFDSWVAAGTPGYLDDDLFEPATTD